MRRRAVLLLPAFLLLPALAGCGDTDGRGDAMPGMSAPAATVAATPSATAATTTGTFASYAAGVTAITYDPALVPAGATAAVTLTPAGDDTTVQLAVTRLRPGRTYGAHLHVKPCGPTGDAAGPHYQHHPDPAASAPSIDPSYANPGNEVWLDVATDSSGDATTIATQPWTFDPARTPRSLVIHTQATKTGAGVAGTAGTRLACLTLPG